MLALYLDPREPQKNSAFPKNAFQVFHKLSRDPALLDLVENIRELIN